MIIYLGCELDERLPGETMALKVINKINGSLNFLSGKNGYLGPYIKLHLCNALTLIRLGFNLNPPRRPPCSCCKKN